MLRRSDADRRDFGRRFSPTRLFALWIALGLAATSARAQEEPWDDEPNASARKEQIEALSKDIAFLERQSNVLKNVVRLVGPSVVHIDAERNINGRKGDVEEAGSGFFVRFGEQHYVLTNRHVIKNSLPADIKIRLADGRVLNPNKVLSDPDTDVAVLLVSAPRLTSSLLADSGAVDIGDFVLAIGSPFGLSHSVTFGIISAKGRRDLKLGDEVHFQDFLQTDAAINPGNSGGPLINLRGEVVGMNTAIASSSGGNEGIGFTIPINMVVFVAKQLVERGKVTRAFMGVALDKKFDPAMAISVGLTRPRGARVTYVTPGSPAEIAQIHAGDILLKYDGVPVDNDSHLINMVSLTEIGKTVPVLVFRDHKQLTLSVKVGAAPAKPAANSSPARSNSQGFGSSLTP
jgi:serine protease Do